MVAAGVEADPGDEAEGSAQDAGGAVVVDNRGDAEAEGERAGQAPAGDEGGQAQRQSRPAKSLVVLQGENEGAGDAEAGGIGGGADADGFARDDGDLPERRGAAADEGDEGQADRVRGAEVLRLCQTVISLLWRFLGRIGAAR